MILPRKLEKILLIPVILFGFICAAFTASVASMASTNSVENFSDVQSQQKNYVAINYLHEKGIIEGYEDSTFKPNQKISRAEALKMIILATGIFTEDEIQNSEVAENPFLDTDKSEWYAKYLTIAKEKGLIKGYNDGTFKPAQTINLAESLKIYFECLGNLEYPQNIENFLSADTKKDDWFANYSAYAYKNNLVYITDANKILPAQEMTRGYIAEIIYRKIMLDQGYEFGKATYYGKAVQGHYTASGEIFDWQKFTTAHKYLPFGAMIEVVNLANGMSVQVKINDRGPYGYGRVLDLSSSAFDEIAWLGSGIINIQFKITYLP